MNRTSHKRSLSRVLVAVLLAAALLIGSAISGLADNGDAATGEKKIIRFAHQFTEKTGSTTFQSDPYKWVLAAKEAFEERNPDYEVQLEYIPGSDYPTKLMSDYSSGITHDVIMVQTAEIAQSIKVGNLYDIRPHFDQWSSQEQAEFTWNPTWSAFEVGEGLYGIPCGLHTRTIAYRKDYFEAVGLEGPPSTMEELREYAIKLTDVDKGIWGLGIYMGPHQASTEVVMLPSIWSMGGDIYDAENNMATFDDPAVAEYIQFMYDCVYVDKVTPAWTLEGVQNETLLQPFLNGQFAMAYGIGNYWISDLQTAGLLDGAYPPTADVDDSKVGWFVVPAEGGVTYANAWGIGVSADTSEPEKAVELMTIALEPEILDKFIAFGGFPGRLSKFDAPEYQGEFWQMWLDISKSGRTLISINYNNLKDSLTAAMQEIITSGSDDNIAEVLLRYQEEFNNRYGGK